MKNTLYLMVFALCATAGMAQASDVAASPAGVVKHGVEGPFFPAVRPATASPVASTGDVLQAQAMARLKANFDAADVAKNGSLTQQQAQKSRLGYVANNFSKIDVNKTGKVTFDDVKHYLQSQQ
ncbi:Pyruvate/2-oxoglutarate dehydrogenase complex [Collimonas arenae]|uniref:Pyruvate/2-oxoglutarate dehydrogenase complex n=1 Tax=Collimonas arenae TaxID=279058 RepID=A0A0A1FA15_9BURK|nr:EF-hand domain-containing protein [Collimonas arenae]AIY41583.1 Pyruvate/2-oxoglutarate dehydrogenase complex [Collimonas arenae]